MTPFRDITNALAAQRGHLFLWIPVGLATGIGTYFSQSVEPTATTYMLLTGTLIALLASLLIFGEGWRPVGGMLAIILIGGLLAALRATLVAEPVLSYRYYGPIQGRIIKIDRSASDAVRLTLDQVVLSKFAPSRTPAKVRVSLHGQQGYIDPQPGLTVILTGHLAGPSGPVEPAGFDFQRHAWFQRLGAVGYTRIPVLSLYPPEAGAAGLFLHRLRMRISASVQRQIPGEAGAFAAAVITGDRGGIGQNTVADLRASNLAHLLAISGLHMGLLTGFVFAVLRYGMALVPFIALRLPVKKIAAVVALLAGAAYLALSGGNIATERAFVMVAVMFTAILLDRRALTLRAVALAAIIILVFRPEALSGPGFQMSFAATTALVAVFGVMRNWQGVQIPKALRPVLAVVISSAVAGAATAPIAAAHFNRIADFGLLANLLSVPLMGIIVMPGAVLAACLAPFGLGWIGLALMAPAIRWILGVAHWVATLEGAVSYVQTPPPVVIPMMVLGCLWLILWRGSAWVRGVGLAPIALSFVIWAQAERPPLLISDTAGLIGVMTPEGRALNKPKGEGFAAQSWLENDGDGADQQAAFARKGFSGSKGQLEFEVAGIRYIHLSGRGATERVADVCVAGTVVILAAEHEFPDPPCQIIDRSLTKTIGAIAVSYPEGKLTLTGSKTVAGQRLWNTPVSKKGRRNGP